MLKKYNVALIPTSKRQDIIKLAQIFSDISGLYQLAEASLPHVTLCQFRAEENEIDSIWQKVCKMLPESSIDLEFKDFSCIALKNNFWVSLMPNQRTVLLEMHKIVTSAIKQPINELYDPHMTLINTIDGEYKKKVRQIKKSYTPIYDTFILSVGESDEVGQFIKLLKQ